MTAPRLRFDPRTQFDTDRKDHDVISNALIEARDLRKTYQLGKRAAVPALRGVDISIAEGEMVAIMGPSGSGKSTLMHILGLLHAPDANGGPSPELWFEGRDMTRLSESERTREIGIKRAIGGSRTRIVREFVAESALIGFLGGVIGLTLGAGVAWLGNELGRDSGLLLFLLTPMTAVTAIGFSTILGALAGLVPALHASRLDPVTALRYE